MMRRLAYFSVLLLGVSAMAAAAAAAPSFDPPLGKRPPVAGARTQMLNLGSPHLSEFSQLKPEMAEPLLARLARFRPTVITHEAVSGEQCDMMRRAPRYKDAVESYCWDPAPAQKLAGLSQQAAEARAEEMLDLWAAERRRERAPEERRRLALLFLAAGERGSAWVQWLRLPPAERRAADGLDAAMVDILDRKGRGMNESFNVAAVLAARLGPERIYAVDDHSSDGAMRAGKDYERAMIARFARLRDDPVFKDYMAAAQKVQDGPSLLAFYRLVNAPAMLNRQMKGDFGGTFADAKAAPFGRQYGAWWEVRNLRMIANIRAATVDRPGARVLNVVGVSHRPWYDAWMRQMADVEVVALEPYLR